MREWESGITEIIPGRVTTYGVDQADAIKSLAFEDVIFLLLQQRSPSAVERDLLRAVLVSHMSHGITGQSTLAVRMAADTRASFIHALIAGFSTGAGPFHQGGLEATMREIQSLAVLPAEDLADHLDHRLATGDRIMGFGHRYHKAGDPRADALFAVTQTHAFEGPHIRTVRAAGQILQDRKGLPINIEAAGAAILLDLGFETQTSHLFIVLGRSTMFAAAYAERLQQSPTPFPRIRICDE